jgi:hypothetical protein
MKIRFFDIDFDTTDSCSCEQENCNCAEEARRKLEGKEVIVDADPARYGEDFDTEEQFLRFLCLESSEGADLISDETGWFVNTFKFELIDAAKLKSHEPDLGRQGD